MIECHHYWKIGDLIPDQPKDQGTCVKCGQVRPFKPQFIDLAYTDLHKRLPTTQRKNRLDAQREVAYYTADKLMREV